MTIIHKLASVLCTLALFGCATDLNMHNAGRYFDASLQAESQENWAGAYEGYRRAVVDYRSAGAPVAYVSAATYNMGRMAGYQCKYDEAEQLLLEAVSLEQQTGSPDPGNMTKRWSELARLYEARGQFQESATYYRRAVPEVERLGMPADDPIGFADYLDAFARVLRSAGQQEAALQVAQRATGLRASNPGKAALARSITYKSVCEPLGALAPEDLSASVRTSLEKAKAGDAAAQFAVAVAFDNGRGAPRNRNEAMRWYKSAAEQGHAAAQNSVGSVLQAEKKYAEARGWYEKAAAQDDARATHNLAALYDLGLGVAQDRKRAFGLYSKAADMGWAESMWNMANQYGAGQLGQPPDLLAACIWTLRAATFARSEEKHLIARANEVTSMLSRRLSDDQMRSCQLQALSWSPPRPAARDDLPMKTQ